MRGHHPLGPGFEDTAVIWFFALLLSMTFYWPFSCLAAPRIGGRVLQIIL